MPKKIYLAGKISVADSATFYRTDASKKLTEAGFKCYSPLRRKGPTSEWHKFTPSEIVQRDLQDVLNADMVLAVINEEGRKISFGTPCECMFAWTKHIPVVLVSNNEALRNHYWTQIICAKVFSKIEDAVDYIINYWFGDDDGDEIEVKKPLPPEPGIEGK